MYSFPPTSVKNSCTNSVCYQDHARVVWGPVTYFTRSLQSDTVHSMFGESELMATLRNYLTAYDTNCTRLRLITLNVVYSLHKISIFFFCGGVIEYWNKYVFNLLPYILLYYLLLEQAQECGRRTKYGYKGHNFWKW